ncbi:MAG: PDZ domain-containing protein, partial [Lachnospiraceae bacterium]|nr:PDZ domain-containing protein [Lachnospiraceae bacterium]
VLGNAVMAVGSPLGNASICYGAVTSAQTMVGVRDAAYQLLTTDMQGDKNASGVIVNLRGQVVGILCHGHEAEGLENLLCGYGISGIRRLIEDLSNQVARPYMGLHLSDVSPDVVKELGLPDGVFVEQVEMDSPAMAGGLAKGDLIQKVGDITVKTVSEYMAALAVQEADTEVEITYARLSGQEYRTMSVSVQLGTRE